MNRLFRDIHAIRPAARASVACIGAFDGLHRGHQALVRHAVARARALDVEAIALSFEPLPREFFAGAAAPPRLSLPRAKFAGLRALDVDRVGLLRFDAALAAMPAREFVERVLVDRLAVREVWVGPEFAFGAGRGGDLALLETLGERRGFVAAAIDPVVVDGQRVSSSAIRAMLGAGEFDRAERLLGRPYAISGKVVRGAQLGRKLGFPTANLRLGGRMPALGGIFATRVHGVRGQAMDSVSSLGMRPTVDGSERLLEAHLFDYDGDLYGRRIEVEFVARLRDELRFDNLDALTAQMRRDAAEARAILGGAQRRQGAGA